MRLSLDKIGTRFPGVPVNLEGHLRRGACSVIGHEQAPKLVSNASLSIEWVPINIVSATTSLFKT